MRPTDILDRCAVHIQFLVPESHFASFRYRYRFRPRPRSCLANVWLRCGFSRRLKPMVGDPFVLGLYLGRGRNRNRYRFPWCIARDPHESYSLAVRVSSASPRCDQPTYSIAAQYTSSFSCPNPISRPFDTDTDSDPDPDHAWLTPIHAFAIKESKMGNAQFRCQFTAA
jgi:hypothetical protein